MNLFHDRRLMIRCPTTRLSSIGGSNLRSVWAHIVDYGKWTLVILPQMDWDGLLQAVTNETYYAINGVVSVDATALLTRCNRQWRQA